MSDVVSSVSCCYWLVSPGLLLLADDDAVERTPADYGLAADRCHACCSRSWLRLSELRPHFCYN